MNNWHRMDQQWEILYESRFYFDCYCLWWNYSAIVFDMCDALTAAVVLCVHNSSVRRRKCFHLNRHRFKLYEFSFLLIFSQCMMALNINSVDSFDANVYFANAVKGWEMASNLSTIYGIAIHFCADLVTCE